MYEINGDFGSVRLCRACMSMPALGLPFVFKDGGWHHCSDLYHMYRLYGLEGYMLFFSTTEGGRVRVKDRMYEVPANSVTILPPGQEHEYYTEEGQWWEFYWIHFGEACGDILDKVIERQGHVFESKYAVRMGQLVEELIAERFMVDEIQYELKASHNISQMIHMLLEDIYNMENAGKHSHECVLRLLREIEENYGDKINIAGIAEKYYISEQHLIRLFKNRTGYTPYAYLKKYRLQKAGELMIYSKLSIGEIADKTGFMGVNNFLFQFKNEFGMTPKQYRLLHSM